MQRRIVIIGGVAGGMSAATRARRMNEDASITVLERGGYISFANCGLPYYVAGRIASENKLLVTTAQQVRERFNIDVRVKHDVTAIDPAAKIVHVTNLEMKEVFTLGYDKLILAPGASPIVPPIDHAHAENVFVLRSMEETRRMKEWIAAKKPKNAVIVGAGFIGLEMAEALRDQQLQVTIVEKAPQVLPMLDADMASWIEDELKIHEVKVITGTGLKSLAATNGLVSAVELENGKMIDADLVVLSIGVRPSTELAKACGLIIGASGGIAVDAFQRTNDADIYAVGDATEVVHGVTNVTMRIPLAGPANRQGRTAGEHAATDHALPSAPVLGTAIVQVFDLSVGITGLSEAAAARAKLNYDVAYVLPNDHAGYYPDAHQMAMKLVYEKSRGRILGAQISGAAGVDKRLDVIATTMHFRGSIDDLASLDLAYAPQYGSAKDAVHFAAMVAHNQSADLSVGVSPNDATQWQGQLVDVRSPKEFADGSLPGAVNIPLDSLRERMNEINAAKPTLVFCKVGVRGYIAQRILKQSGFKDVRNIKGGYTFASRAGKYAPSPAQSITKA